MNSQHESLFKLPRQDLRDHSLFALAASAAAEWANHLPKTNLGETSRLLLLALSELNRVRLHPILRLELLEELRPAVHFAAAGLSKHYLNQPIVMAEKAQKAAELAHALRDQLASGYILVALHADGVAGSDQGISLLLSTALHRAICELGDVLVLHNQLYRDPPSGIWLKLHQMMLLAQQNVLDQQTILDELLECSITITAMYLRAALFGATKPFQLRQHDMSLIAKGLLQWSSLAQLTDWPDQGMPVLAVNPAEDLPPRFGNLLKDRPGQCFALATGKLVGHLQSLFEQAAPGALTLKLDQLLIPVDLLKHVIHAWSEISKRNFMRLEAYESVDLCIGLMATHNFLSDGLPFDKLIMDTQHLGLMGDTGNRFLQHKTKTSRGKDVWDSPYESNFGQTNITLATLEIAAKSKNTMPVAEEKYSTYPVHTINLSPGGYCVKWPPEDPAQIRTGEIIGIREHRSMKWSIGLIRWAKSEAGNIQLGLELISPSAQPYGARMVQKVGEQGDFFRVLLLPELKSLGQPASLITPNVPFKSQQKIVIRQNGKETSLQLGRRIAGNTVYSQFLFRQYGENTTEFGGDNAILRDDLWSSL